MKPTILGIAGGSGSGKTFIVNNLLKNFNEFDITVINQDSYYKDLSNIEYNARLSQNFDHPKSIDIKLLESHIKKILKGKNIKIPVYDFSKHIRTTDTISISTCKTIIIEGIFALHFQQLRKLYTLKIFVETPEKVRFERRLNRDVKERNRSPKSVKSQYLNTVFPMHNKFIAPSKKYANIIINGNKNIKSIMKDIKTNLKEAIL